MTYLNKLIAILFLCCSFETFAYEQEYIYSSKFFPVSVQSPQAADLGKYGETSLSHYTGRANVTIPLYSIMQNGIPLDIHLTYDTSGMQMNSLPGIMGHGWTLNIGGCIVRAMKQDYDEMVYRDDLPWAATFKNYFQAHDTLTNAMAQTSEERGKLFKNRYLNYDLSPDIFYFNFMGKTGKFFLGNDGKWKVDSDENLVVIFDQDRDTSYIYPFISTLPYRDNFGYGNHEQPKTIKGFTLIDDKGTRYVFGAHDGGNNTNAIEYSTDMSSCSDYEDLESWHATAWYLTNVKDRFGNVVYKFTYQRGEYIAQIYNAFAGVASSYNNNNYQRVIHNGDFPYSMTLVSPVYLSSVKTNDLLKVTLSYKDALEYPALRGDSLYPNFYQKLNKNNISLINNILHTYNEDTHVSEKYDKYPFYYLQTPIDSMARFRVRSNDTIQNPLSATGLRLLNKIIIFSERLLDPEPFAFNLREAPNSTSETITFSYTFPKRAQLTEISHGSEKRYRFSYYYPDSIPHDYLTKKVDHWGFYNGTEYSLPTISNTSIIFSQRAPNPTKSQYGALKEIVYPTGGCSKFTYEQNYYSSYVLENKTGLATESGYAGGLRVSKIENFENTSHNKRLSITQYQYICEDETSSFGILYSKPRYIWENWHPKNNITVNIIRITPIFPLSSDDGYHIGYSRVKEILGDSTYTVYEYRDLADNLDERYVWTIMDSTTTTPFDHYSSREYRRGQLLKETIKDKTNNAIKSAEYIYRSDNVENNYVLTSTINLNNPNVVDRFNLGYGYDIGVIYKLFYPKYDVVKIHTTTNEENGSIEDSIVYVKLDSTLNARHQNKNYPGAVRKTLSEMQYRQGRSIQRTYNYPFTCDTNDTTHMRMVKNFYLPAISEELFHNSQLVKKNRTKYATLYDKDVPYLDLETWPGQVTDTLVYYQQYTNDGHLEYYQEVGKSRTRLFWDEDRLIAKITGPNVESIEFNPDGNSPLGMFVINNRSIFETPLMEAYVYMYDGIGNVVSVTQPNGYTTYYEYDNLRRLTAIKDMDGHVVQDFVYHYR